MDVLAVHNYHRKGSASGDDQVFKSETELLEKYGNRVVRYTVSNDEYDKAGMIGKIQSIFGMFWSAKNYKAVKHIIKKEKPDIVHVHTFFPLLSPSILYAAKKMGVPVVATLHDTRFICPCATSLRGTKICNKCGDGRYLRMCRYRCFKDSRIMSLAVACIFKYHRLRKSFYNQIDRYICLNDNQIKLLKKNGFDKNKIVKKYNFVSDTDLSLSIDKYEGLPEKYVVFYGRIGKEKGIYTLMKAWNNLDIPIVVMGAGPLENEFGKWAEENPNVYYLGYMEHEKCLKIVRDSEFVVFPSIWYEGCSMVEIETMSLGKGVIATDLGFSKEAVIDGYNGYKFPLGNISAFENIIKKLWDSPQKCVELGVNARKEYEQKYCPKDNYIELMKIYKSTIKGKTNALRNKRVR